MDSPVLADLLVEAARLVDADQVTELRESEWLVVTDGELALSVENDTAVGRLVFTADLGPLADDTPARRLELLLGYNAAWDQHGGLRIALDTARRELQLLLDLPAGDLTLQRLAGVLTGFGQATSAWRAALARPALPDTPGVPAADASLQALLAFGAIRG